MSERPVDPALFEENERTAPDASSRHLLPIGRVETDSGGVIEDAVIAYETWGRLNADKSNAILACHALSGDSHVLGWWERVFGSGKAIDPADWFIIGINALGGCQGSTGPGTLDAEGRRLGSRFPLLSVGDIVRAHKKVLDHLGIDRLAMACGGSMGGMQALELSLQFPERVARCWMTASCCAHSAMQIGFNEAGRQAILRDPNWQGGNYAPGSGPDHGLSVARMVGHLSYLSDRSFTVKFGRGLQDKEKFAWTNGVEFQVESYLSYQGDKFTKRFDASSYIVLTRAIDYFERRDFSAAECDFLFTSFNSDWLYPSYQSEELMDLARGAGKRAEWLDIDLPWGHDAFLLDGEEQTKAVLRFLGA